MANSSGWLRTGVHDIAHQSPGEVNPQRPGRWAANRFRLIALPQRGSYSAHRSRPSFELAAILKTPGLQVRVVCGLMIVRSNSRSFLEGGHVIDQCSLMRSWSDSTESLLLPMKKTPDAASFATGRVANQ